MLRYVLISILIIDFFNVVYGCHPVSERDLEIEGQRCAHHKHFYEEKINELCLHVTCDSQKVKELCTEHCSIKNSGDNLVVIAGVDLYDVELISTQTNNGLCNPMDLDYTVHSHSSVGTPLGVLTCGGWTGRSSTSKCALQPKEGQTTTFPSMKRKRYYFGLGIVNDTVYAVGGQGGRSERTMEKINFKTDSEWTMTNLQFSVYEHCLATTIKSLVITGGYHYWSYRYLDTTWVFNLETEEWTRGPKMKEKRSGHSCFYDIKSNSVFVIGGWNGKKRFATTERWNLDTNQWESTPSLPKPLTYSAGVASKSMDYMGFVAGGEINSGRKTNEIFGLRRRDLKWEIMPQQLQKARTYHSMVNLDSDQVPGC